MKPETWDIRENRTHKTTFNKASDQREPCRRAWNETNRGALRPISESFGLACRTCLVLPKQTAAFQKEGHLSQMIPSTEVTKERRDVVWPGMLTTVYHSIMRGNKGKGIVNA